MLFLLNEWSCCRNQIFHCLALSLSKSVSAFVELSWRAKIVGFVSFIYVDFSKLLCGFFKFVSCNASPSWYIFVFLDSLPPQYSWIHWPAVRGVKVNFLARCGQKSDLSGLCGIGYWVSGLVKCLPQSQWLLQSYKRSFDGKSNIKESSKSVAITII